MESMERIDVLKDIEQILVQKAYETGHISHRADGDWQKQADGSWKPYTGQSNQNFKKYDNRTRFGGDGTLLTQDQVAELQQIKDMNERKKRQEEMLAENRKDADSSYEKMKYGEITEEDLKGSNTTDTSNIDTKEKKRDVQNKIDGVFKLRDEDTKKMLGIRRDDSKEHGYDGEIRFYADDDRNIKPASDRKEFDKVVQYYLDKAGLEDTPFNHKVAHKYIVGYAKNNGLIGDYYWSKVLYPNGYESDDENVRKSAVRDMRSTLAIKNMGF